jgi:hypothetical protein
VTLRRGIVTLRRDMRTGPLLESESNANTSITFCPVRPGYDASLPKQAFCNTDVNRNRDRCS